jgi:hypothetical protein
MLAATFQVQEVVEPTNGSIHDHGSSAQGAALLFASLDLNDTTNAKDVLTVQTNWLIC